MSTISTDPIDDSTTRDPDILHERDIPWRLDPIDDDVSVDLLLFGADGVELFQYARSLQDDVKGYRHLVRALLTLAHDLIANRDRALARVAQLLDALRAANAEIRRLRIRVGEV